MGGMNPQLLLSEVEIAIDSCAGYLDFWCAAPTVIECTSATVTRNLSDVDIPNLTGKDIAFAVALMELNTMENTNAAANYSNRVASVIQVDKAAAGWLTAIAPDGGTRALNIEGNQTRYGGRFVGNVDIAARVGFNATTNFRWFETRMFANNINLHVMTGVRVFLKNP